MVNKSLAQYPLLFRLLFKIIHNAPKRRFLQSQHNTAGTQAVHVSVWHVWSTNHEPCVRYQHKYHVRISMSSTMYVYVRILNQYDDTFINTIKVQETKIKSEYSAADPGGGGGKDACPRPRTNFLHFHAFFGKKLVK